MTRRVPQRRRRPRGRKPSALPEAARLTLDAIATLDDARYGERSRPIPAEVRHTFSQIRDQVLKPRANTILLGLSGKEFRSRPEVRWADSTTRNGLRWLGCRKTVARDPDGRYQRVNDVGGILLNLERTISSIRLEGRDIEWTYRGWKPGGGSPPPLEKERHFTKTFLASAIARAERDLDALHVPGWTPGAWDKVDLIGEAQRFRDEGRFPDPPKLRMEPLVFGKRMSTAEFFRDVKVNRKQFGALMSAFTRDPLRVEAEWSAVVNAKKAKDPER
jgi:hypothetical protein